MGYHRGAAQIGCIFGFETVIDRIEDTHRIVRGHCPCALGWHFGIQLRQYLRGCTCLTLGEVEVLRDIHNWLLNQLTRG